MSLEPDRSRRDLLLALAGCAGGLCWARPAGAQDSARGASIDTGPPAGLAGSPARWWKGVGELKIECGLCPHRCRVADRERGTCGVRENRAGKYETLVYGRPCALHVDPIEKKPFHHVLPGTSAFSLAAPGCNLECKFCQNWELSQVRPEQVTTYAKSPEAIVSLARNRRCPTIACTYGEPTVWSEYVWDIAVAGKKAGIRTLTVTNGFIEAAPMSELASVVTAVKIDLKAFTERFYRDVCGARLAPVLDTLRLLKQKGIWTEIVTLVIPGLNDSAQELQQLAQFVRTDLGPDVPLHFTRFSPTYRLQNVPVTPVASLTRARDIALREGLHYVYVGNVPGHAGSHTYCPSCRKILIRRVDVVVTRNRLVGGKCPDCGQVIPGIWS